jgi:hypothetical protein
MPPAYRTVLIAFAIASATMLAVSTSSAHPTTSYICPMRLRHNR